MTTALKPELAQQLEAITWRSVFRPVNLARQQPLGTTPG
jgi:hypothetical protein